MSSARFRFRFKNALGKGIKRLVCTLHSAGVRQHTGVSCLIQGYYESGITVYYDRHQDYYLNGENWMNAEIKELNRMICRSCGVKDYSECRNCRIYELINKIASQ